jgi:hypothetical protein
MRVYINAYPLLTERVPVTLIADVDTKEEAFSLAELQWSDDLKCVRIEEVVDEGFPRTWTLTWFDDMPRIERSPNDYCDVGYHLVSALINGDVSGIEQYPNCVFEPDEGESFAKCEVTDKHNNCVRVKVYAR